MGFINLKKSNPHFMKGYISDEITNFVMLFYIKFFIHW
jgi:hypothetical protein